MGASSRPTVNGYGGPLGRAFCTLLEASAQEDFHLLFEDEAKWDIGIVLISVSLFSHALIPFLVDRNTMWTEKQRLPVVRGEPILDYSKQLPME